MPAVTATTNSLNATSYQVGDEDPSGMLFGQNTTSKLGFFSATPVARRSTGNNTALTTTSTTTTVLAILTEVQTTLVNLGLMPST